MMSTSPQLYGVTSFVVRPTFTGVVSPLTCGAKNFTFLNGAGCSTPSSFHSGNASTTFSDHFSPHVCKLPRRLGRASAHHYAPPEREGRGRPCAARAYGSGASGLMAL